MVDENFSVILKELVIGPFLEMLVCVDVFSRVVDEVGRKGVVPDRGKALPQHPEGSQQLQPLLLLGVECGEEEGLDVRHQLCEGLRLKLDVDARYVLALAFEGSDHEALANVFVECRSG